jgi:hypothetical protein
MVKDRCLWGIQHWRELLSQSDVIFELLNDTVTLTGGVLEFPAVHTRRLRKLLINPTRAIYPSGQRRLQMSSVQAERLAVLEPSRY